MRMREIDRFVTMDQLHSLPLLLHGMERDVALIVEDVENVVVVNVVVVFVKDDVVDGHGCFESAVKKKKRKM